MTTSQRASAAVRGLLAVVLATLVGFAIYAPTSTTAASAATFTYDIPANARVSIHEFEAAGTSPAHLSATQEGSASLAAEGRGTSTTPLARSIATNTVDGFLPKPIVSNTKLQNIVNDLYKGTTNPGRVGTGTTADAVRSELATGLATGGKFHSEKAQIYINGLNKVLRQDLTASDRLVAQSLLDDLTNALGGVP